MKQESVTKKLYDILRRLQSGDIGTDGAHIEIMNLFNNCTDYHKIKEHYLGNNIYIKQCTICKLIIE